MKTTVKVTVDAMVRALRVALLDTSQRARDEALSAKDPTRKERRDVTRP